MKILFVSCLTAFVFAAVVRGSDFHVSPDGRDTYPGTRSAPFKTIQHAADLAQPDDVIIVHEGVYRERINPPRGGQSAAERIVYQAAPGEKVVIKGSEVVTNWVKVQDDVWKATLPNLFFGNFNPYSDLIHGDWFKPMGRQHHTGCVYLNGDWLMEAASLNDILKSTGTNALWFAQVDATNTTIWAQFKNVNPNEQFVEINKRQTVFYPEKTGINYLTVRGFTMEQAATPWAPPTAEQKGLIGTHWSKGWIIENNIIRYSKCSGIALGKYGDEFDNTNDKGAADPYTECVRRALKNGWNKLTVGSHLVRNNHISYCEQAGIVGSLGCSFSTVTDNVIHDIHVQHLFGGAEMAGIKFHGAIDVIISHNHIYRCCDVSGIWLDWMAQGAQVEDNLLHDNTGDRGDLFFEMQHGPILVANNLLLSKRMAIFLNSQGIAFVHNLITGPVHAFSFDERNTPFYLAHSTVIAGLTNAPGGDHRFYNNLFVAPCNLHAVDNARLPCFAEGNVFTTGSQPSKFDTAALLKPEFDAHVNLAEKSDGWYLTIAEDRAWRDEMRRRQVTTDMLEKAKTPNLPYENADGSPIFINTDYFGNKRNEQNPFPGPFEISADGTQTFKVWPVGKATILTQ